MLIFYWSWHTISIQSKLINPSPSLVSFINSACTLLGTSEAFYSIWKPLDEVPWLTTLGHKRWQNLIFVISLCICSAVLHSPWISLFLAKLFYSPQVFPLCCFSYSISRWISFFFFRLKERKGENCFLNFKCVWSVTKNCSVHGMVHERWVLCSFELGLMSVVLNFRYIEGGWWCL